MLDHDGSKYFASANCYGNIIFFGFCNRVFYKKLFKIDGIDLDFEEGAFEYIVDKAIEFRNKFAKENVADTAFTNTAKRSFIVAQNGHWSLPL